MVEKKGGKFDFIVETLILMFSMNNYIFQIVYSNEAVLLDINDIGSSSDLVHDMVLWITPFASVGSMFKVMCKCCLIH